MQNQNIVIISDSSCDLTQDIIQKYDIKIVPFFVSIGGESYRDGIDIKSKELIEKVDQYKELPKTASISPGQYHEVFAKYADDADIIFIGLGSGFSASYSSAQAAATAFTNVYAIDSLNLSSGTGLLILKMCKMREEGKSVKEIVDEIKRLIPLVRTQFAINTLDYLHMGGRCSGTSRLFGTMLRLKPIIRVVDGKMVVAKKPIGYNRALSSLIEYVDKDFDNIDLDNIMITHCLADEDAKYLRQELEKRFKNTNILETFASGVISTHCGPRCIGILYILKK